ncbi:AAA family ATPase [Streptomyces sp. NPDC050560]|uniref:AAA family ATPase n=1 Tax=Streptomyces sp. NPDC050560 TaxID=3365630 RepID=UPI00378E1B7A
MRPQAGGPGEAAGPHGPARAARGGGAQLFFTSGVLDPSALGDPRTADVLMAAAQRVSARLRPSDVLHAALAERGGPLPALETALAEGAAVRHVLDTVDVYNPPGDGYEFDGSPAGVAPELLAALDDFAAFADSEAERAAASAAGPDPSRSVLLAKPPPPARRGRLPGRLADVALELLVACVLENPDAQDREFLGVLDAPLAARLLRERVRIHLEPLPELFDDSSGRLRSEEFTADAWATLEQAAGLGADLGYDRLLPPHVLLALLSETEGLAERLVRLQLPPHISLVKAVEIIAAAFRLSTRGREAPPRLHRDETGDTLVTLLRGARRTATYWGAERIDTPHLLAALLDEPPQRLAGVLSAEPLRLDLNKLRGHLREALRDARNAVPREVPYKLPSFLPPSEDLTYLARTDGILPARHLDHYFDPLSRALHRSENNHVLITGLPGVGTTTLLRELARRAAAGEIPFLRRKRFLRVDCRDVAPEQSKDQLAELVGQVSGRTDLVVCVDGLGRLLRGPHGVNHLLELRRALGERRLHLIGVLTAHDYEDLLTTDHALQEMTTRVDVVEPGQQDARAMVRQAADGLAQEFDVRVDERAVARAVVLAGDFIAHQKLPLSAVRVLRRACEDLHYARTQQGGTRDAVETSDVVGVVAELSGVPREQIAGISGERVDHAAALATEVVGQEAAVRVVAEELRRIKSGLAGVSSGPASVLLFAGLTGVGKTELAKAVANLYSASKRLQTYPMENFTEPHSVSGIIGSPPGYIGHDQGGRLINELNADPYCVFLLDETEKAHPEVLRPFLNLFDEGWITDQRGVKAHGDRAIFVMTTNAGHEVISSMPPTASDEQIAAAVRARLGKITTRRGENVFTPEFLARIRRIVVFRPLGLDAMTGIGRKVLERQRAFWRDKREKELVVPEELLRYAGETGHRLNTEAQGREGGRIMARLLSDLVETPVLAAVERDQTAYRRAATIAVGFRVDAAGNPHTTVDFPPAENPPAEPAAAEPGAAPPLSYPDEGQDGATPAGPGGTEG